MRNRLMGMIVLMIAVLVIPPGMEAQTAPASGATKAIPSLSGLWEVPVDQFGSGRDDRRDICGEPSCTALLRAGQRAGPPVQYSKNTVEPQMLPWAEEQYKSVREGLQDPNALSNQALNPSWGGCLPEGPTESTRRRGFELRQFPDVALLLFDHDHAVRRIYLNGQHPADWKPAWMGHSIGRYDGETLVVDTIGINDKAWIDAQGHPHSDALRVTERIRRLDPNTLEIEMTFNDPKTYAKPWTKRALHKLRSSGPNVWDSTECEELLRLGTHYSTESKK